MEKGKKNTILVGIDYTKSSENALYYALMLAKKKAAKVVLLHVFDFPIVHTYSGLYTLDYKSLKENDLSKLEQVKKLALKKHPGADVEIISTSESVKTFVKELVDKKKIDYVVLGLETKTKISKFIYGTTGVDLASKIDCPVIIVPESYKVHKLKHALITVDNKHNIKKRSVEKVKKFAKRYECSQEIIHIKTEDEFLMIYERNPKKDNEKWNVKTIEAKSFGDGINKYTKIKNTDLIVLFSHSHSAFYNFFNETNTKLIAFQSKTPVMSIHEK